jgi:hypothetical protein
VLGLMAAAVTTTALPPTAAQASSGDATDQALAVPNRSLILAADQASARVLVLDANDSTWLAHNKPALRSAASAARWSWSPTDADDLDDLSPHRTWDNVSEAKHRVLDGQEWLLTCASAGLAALVSYPSGRVRWATEMLGANPHSIELLPHGNIAVAASAGGFIRLYAASRSSRSTRHAHFDLPGARGVHWDDTSGTLWALGDFQLFALKVGGTSAHPTLTPAYSIYLPTPGGHDLGTATADRLWVTTNGHVLQYSIPDTAFVPYNGQATIDGAGVKSIGADPLTGQVLTVAPSSDNPCTWCTSTITFHLPDGRQGIAGTSLYKARWTPRPTAH